MIPRVTVSAMSGASSQPLRRAPVASQTPETSGSVAEGPARGRPSGVTARTPARARKGAAAKAGAAAARRLASASATAGSTAGSAIPGSMVAPIRAPASSGQR